MGGHFIHDNQNVYHNPVRGPQSSGFQQLATIDWSTKPSEIGRVPSYHFPFFNLVFTLSYLYLYSIWLYINSFLVINILGKCFVK